MSNDGFAHIPRRPGHTRSWCGAPVRKSMVSRRQECPQCKRVRKRETEGK